LNKPDLGSSYNNEVLETLRGHIARLWTGTWGSMAGVVNGMLRWEIPGGNVLKLWRRNGSGTDDLVFDSTSLLGDGTVTTPKLANGVLSADAAGRAKMADGFLSADAAGRAKMADWFVTPIKLSTGAPTWDTSGNLRVTASTGGIGYGTGAGGTVTQSTSRTNSVTLNRPTGEVQMFTGAGSPTWNRFFMNNNTIAGRDIVVAQILSFGPNEYILKPEVPSGGGGVNFAFKSDSGTSTDAPIIRFAVIKGVIS